jgi:hypothetical protein
VISDTESDIENTLTNISMRNCVCYFIRDSYIVFIKLEVENLIEETIESTSPPFHDEIEQNESLSILADVASGLPEIPANRLNIENGILTPSAEDFIYMNVEINPFEPVDEDLEFFY